MDKLELSKLLTTFSLVDHRTVEPETVNAWYDVLGDLDVDFAYRAGVEHFRESTDYLTPAHLVAGARRLQQRNTADVREGQARGVIPTEWPASRALTPQLAEGLAVDRVARRGVWIGKSWSSPGMTSTSTKSNECSRWRRPDRERSPVLPSPRRRSISGDLA